MAGVNNSKVVFDFNVEEMHLTISMNEVVLFVPIYKKNSRPLLTEFIRNLQLNQDCEITLSPLIVIKLNEEKIPILSGLSVLEFNNSFEIRSSLLNALLKVVEIIGDDVIKNDN
jgi:hypothetical protein